MKIVSFGTNFHEMSNPIFWEHKKVISILFSVNFAMNIATVEVFGGISILITVIIFPYVLVVMQYLVEWVCRC